MTVVKNNFFFLLYIQSAGVQHFADMRMRFFAAFKTIFYFSFFLRLIHPRFVGLFERAILYLYRKGNSVCFLITSDYKLNRAGIPLKRLVNIIVKIQRRLFYFVEIKGIVLNRLKLNKWII